ncbi:hypothetical protein IGI04_014205 [Brassica rapa subsp. trilocularis]|uniref:Phosphoglycerate mutase family protein n=1 Tax=Brassica rapa subsp. trilocularis TaxID=1813537 RepID=A0ABQ7MN49_BRACM|nr:hypothetical protein IGI04_014205 [Brassica rapa subsp. trilocularis]
MESAKSNMNAHQNIIVMRHGDRLDHCEPIWVSTAERPWDPPLVHDGKVRAFQTGQRIRSQIGFPIHRVFVSPFLRCIQTAAEVVAALSADDLGDNAMSSIDISKLKVAIEFGLCETLNTMAIKSDVVPKDGKFDFKFSDLEAMFPEGTFDHNVEMAYKEFPQWGESVEAFKERYVNTLKILAEKYPSENLLLVTHWGGVSSMLYKYFKDATKYLVDYCGCVELRRPIMDNDGFGESVDFEVVTSHGVAFKDNKAPIHAKINGHQNVIVMRHGDRADRCEPLWVSTAVRPWDPPLVHDGKVRAFQTGQRIRSQVGFPIHRVIVSPFLRCIQTAAEVVAALSAVYLDDNAMSSKDVPSIDNSKLKVAIEFGLCEILNTVAIKSDVAPKDGKFDFKISDLQAMFPEETVDINVDMACKELPQWEESAAGFKERYVSTLKVLADKYPSENLLLVTHWGGVGTILYKYFNDATKYLVDYCGCVELRRQVSNNDESEEFEVVTSHGVAFKDNKAPIHGSVIT